MSWRISFEYDAAHEVVLASFSRCVLVSAKDVEQWQADMAEGLARFGRKVDLVMNLEGLEVSFSAGRAFTQARRQLVERFALGVCGFGGDSMTQLFFTTSGNVFQSACTPHADSHAAALAAVVAQRGGAQVAQEVTPAPRPISRRSVTPVLVRGFRKLALG